MAGTVERYCRFGHEGAARFGWVEDDRIIPMDAAPWEGGRAVGRAAPLASVRLLAPSPASKIVCVGQNYRKHALEMGKPLPDEPLLFLKASSALNGSGSPICLPRVSQDVHHEAELGLVIGERLRHASPSEAQRGIYALTCFNDVTARDIQRREIQHTRAKSYDTFACAGPVMVRGLSAEDLRIRCFVNGELRQEGRTSDMIFSPARLVSFISDIMTLLPGDIVSTGTPSGVGPISAGDRVEVDIEGIGTLWNPVQEGA